MPFLIILIGLALVITAIQNTYVQFGNQLRTDAKPFVLWAVAIFAVGLIGYVKGWEKFSRYFLALILIAIVLAQSKNVQGGFFGKFIQQLKAPFPALATASVSGAPQAPLSDPGNIAGVPSSTPPGGWWNWATTAPSVSFTNPFASK